MSAPSVEIPYAKGKLRLLVVLVPFVVVLLLYWAYHANDVPRISSPLRIKLVQLSLTSFSFLLLFLGYVMLRKVLTKQPGLVLLPEGFIDHSTNALTGLVAWADIVGTREIAIGSVPFLVLLLRDPAKYLERPAKPRAHDQLRQNYSQYGSPVVLSALVLECPFPELKALILARLNK